MAPKNAHFSVDGNRTTYPPPKFPFIRDYVTVNVEEVHEIEFNLTSN